MVNTAHTQENIKNSTREGLAAIAAIVLKNRRTRGPG
jgi:hypothetical protein